MTMQYDTNSDVIPPATQFLLSEANKISPVTPEGTPTVASQVLQAAGAMPPMPPQMGMPQVKQMAGLGAQVGATQQQQEQNKIMEMLKQMAQRNNSMNFGVMAAPGAQQFKPPGMAGGGIVGYAGDEGSEVSAEEAERRKQQEERDRAVILSGLEKLLAAGKDVVTLPYRVATDVAENVIARPMRALGAKVPYMPSNVPGAESATPYFDKLRKQEQAATGIEAAYADQSRGRDVVPSAPPVQAPPKAPPTGGIAAPGAVRPQAARSAGIAQLVGPPAPTPLERRESEYRRLIESAQAPTVKTVEQLSAEDAAFRQAQGLPADPDAAARQRLDALRAEAESEQKRRMTTPEGEMWNRLIAGLAGAAGTSNIGYTGAGIARGTARAAEAIEDEKQRNFKLFREFKVAEAKELDLMEKAREQRLYGRKAEADKLAADARAFHNRKVELQANATMDFGKIEEGYAKIASAEKIAGMEAAARKEANALTRENMSIQRLQGRYAEAQRDAATIGAKIEEALEKKYPLAKAMRMDPKMAEQNPDVLLAYNADKRTMEQQYLLPAIRHRDEIAAQLGYRSASSSSPEVEDLVKKYGGK